MLLCYGYDPHTGRYSLAINNILRLAGRLRRSGLGAMVSILLRNEREGTARPMQPIQMRRP